MSLRTLLAVGVLLAAASPAAAQTAIPAPPPEDKYLYNAVPDPGTASPSNPLTLPSNGRPWGTTNMQCWFTDFPKASITSNRSLNRGVTCPQERDRLDQIGANSIRVLIPWYDLEYDRDVWDESMWESLLAKIDAVGRPVLAQIYCTPWWASNNDSLRRPAASTCQHAPLDHPDIDQEAEELAEELVRRLGDRVLAVDVYNEPNFYAAWQPAPDPARYGRLFTAVSRGAHRARGDVKVLFGGGALNVANDASNKLTSETFFKRAITQGGARPRALDAAAGWDGISAHIYPPQSSYRAQLPAEGVSGYVAGSVRDVRRGVRWLDMDSPIWWTETGLTNSGYQRAQSNVNQKVGPGKDWQHPSTPNLKACGTLAAGPCDALVQNAIGPVEQKTGVETMVRYLYSLGDTGAVYVHELFDRGSGTVSNGTAEGASEFVRDGRHGLLATPGGTGTTVVKPAFCRLSALAARPKPSGC